MLAHLRAHLEPRRVGGHHERRMAAGAQLGVDRGDDDVHVGDPAVGCPRLLAVEDPLVLGLGILRPGPQRGDVGAGVRLRAAERRDLGVVDRAVALRHPLAELLGGARGEDPGHGERRAHDRHADPGVAPEQLLVDDREAQPTSVGPELREALVAVEADLRGLMDDRPRRLLALVPFRGCRADDPFGEAVHPLAEVLLVLGELERERRLALLGGQVGSLDGAGGGFHRGSFPGSGAAWSLVVPR